MILVILGVFIALIVVGLILLNTGWKNETLGCTIVTVGVVGFLSALIVVICLAVDVTNLNTVDARIEMYQEENARIEEQIATAVKEFQDHESDIFTELDPESAITLVSLYPDLKSDTLVQKQIEIYIANNESIKELRTEKIQGSVTRWWLYFGK